MVFRFSGYSILTMGLSSILTRLSLTYLGDLRLVASIFAIQLAAVLIWPDPVIRVNGPLTFTFTALRDLDEIIRSHGLLVPWVYIEPPSRRPLSSTFNPARFIRSFLGHFSATTESSLLLSPIIKLAPVFQALLYNAFIVEQPSSADCYKNTPNPDIVGSGVRCSVYLSVLFVFASLSVASFHRQQSGTKELGCTILISECSPVPGCMLHKLTYLDRSQIFVQHA
jgi:hypothetical protein